jgi:cytoskeletal protein CcmA (bactofilin family)
MSKSDHLPSTQSVIGKSLRIKGELSGAEPIHIAGSIIGTISFAGDLVTVGADGDVMAQSRRAI